MNNKKIRIDAQRSSQQPWSCLEVTSILWDLYPKLGWHDIQNKAYMYGWLDLNNFSWAGSDLNRYYQ